MTNQQKKSPKKSHPSKREVHIQEIPKKYFPRNSKAQHYRREIIRMMSNLRYTNEKVQYSAQICAFNIRSITHKDGFIPASREVFRQIAEFVYHYENYCFRAYAFREKTLQFINAMFALNFEERDVQLRFIQSNPIVIKARLVPLIQKFDKNRSFGKVIKDRNSLTHKLYYGESFDHYLRPITLQKSGEKTDAEFKKWCTDWKKEVISRSRMSQECMDAVFDMNHEIAQKVIAYYKTKKK